MPITHWPVDDRPREKLLLKGERSLTDAELIALFLQTGIRGKTSLDIAKALLQEFGNLNQLLSAPIHRVLTIPGVGVAKYARLKAGCELGRRFEQNELKPKMILNNSQHTKNFLSANLRDYGHEVFACLFLNQRFQFLAYEEMFRGTINETNIYPREIVKRALYHNAARVILAHNHPSGDPKPSSADQEVTQIIKQALNLVDIEVSDHIVIGREGNYSFVEKGLL